MNRVYLDQMPLPGRAGRPPGYAPVPFWEFGNAASIHTFGQRARAAVETAREQVAALIVRVPQEIVFTVRHGSR